MTAKIGAFAVTLNLLLTASSATWAADQTVIVCTENLSSGVVVVKSAKDGV
jgi:hypothetical protein